MQGLWLLLFWLVLLVLLLLLLLLLLLFLRHVMSDSATGRRAQHGMMAGHVSRYATYNRTFDATFRFDSVCTDQEGKSEQRCSHRLRFHG